MSRDERERISLGLHRCTEDVFETRRRVIVSIPEALKKSGTRHFSPIRPPVLSSLALVPFVRLRLAVCRASRLSAREWKNRSYSELRDDLWGIILNRKAARD